MPPPPHIVLDARWIFDHISGIGRYTRELLGALIRQHDGERFTLLFTSQELADRERLLHPWREEDGISVRIFPHGPYALRTQWELPGLLRSLRADVYHAPNFVLPYLAFPRGRPAGRIACVSTIHDLIPVLFPEFTPKARKNRVLGLVRAMMRETVWRSDQVITPSACTRADVLRALAPESGSRVRIIHEAASPAYRPGTPHSDHRTVLFVGRRDPYKNLPVLVEAFARVRVLCPSARLVVISGADPRYPEAETLSHRLGLDPHIIWAGYITGGDLVRAYREAAVFVLPSRYEGFGLPVIEAMASGTPVICSNAASLPEITGDAADLVPVGNVEALALAIVRVLNDPDHAADMRRRGLLQVAKFSWDQTARDTLALYHEAADARRSFHL